MTLLDLIADIRTRSMLPDQSISDDDLLRFLNGEISTYILPLLLKVNEEYLVTTSDTPVTTGTSVYDIPENAVGGKIRGVLYASPGQGFRSLPRIEPTDYQNYSYGSGEPVAFMVQGDTIILSPENPSGGGTLRFSFYARPAPLTSTGDDLPDFPLEIFPLLAQRVVAKTLAALGDPKAADARREADEVRDDILTLLQPRVQGLGRVILNRHTPGTRRRYR